MLYDNCIYVHMYIYVYIRADIHIVHTQAFNEMSQCCLVSSLKQQLIIKHDQIDWETCRSTVAIHVLKEAVSV